MLNKSLNYSAEVADAISAGQAVLALESTIIAHGMPYPENLEFAREAESLTRESGAAPATIAIINGEPCIGLEAEQLQILASGDDIEKVATRELGLVCSQGKHGATTVSATMHLAHQAGLQVFATGGIGGVHRGVENSFDVSADLVELSRTPVLVVSAGAKAILDLPRTLEYLETMGVPVIGNGTLEFPAFYSRDSGLTLTAQCDRPSEFASVLHKQREFGVNSGILVANPVPSKFEISALDMENIIARAVSDANQQGVLGKALTPFLLGRIVELTDGRSLVTNRALALNNVKLGAEIARALSELA